MKDWRELAARVKPDAVAPAAEVLQKVYQALLAMPTFRLNDGTKAEVSAFYEPKVDDGGRLRCGIDVLLDNGTHLEFTMENTGWGKSLMTGAKRRRADGARER